MIEPHVHIAYAPRGAGVLCAACWSAQGENVYGWFTGARAYEHPASFFMLERYYSPREAICYRSAENDVHGDWLSMSARGESPAFKHSPVSEALCHELERMQDVFVREWLFHRDDPTHAEEAAALSARELPAMGLNIRPKKLNKLQTDSAVWTYTSTGADIRMIGFLSRRWSLDYSLQ